MFSVDASNGYRINDMKYEIIITNQTIVNEKIIKL